MAATSSLVKSFLWDGCADEAAPLGSSKVTDFVFTIAFSMEFVGLVLTWEEIASL